MVVASVLVFRRRPRLTASLTAPAGRRPSDCWRGEADPEPSSRVTPVEETRGDVWSLRIHPFRQRTSHPLCPARLWSGPEHLQRGSVAVVAGIDGPPHPGS